MGFNFNWYWVLISLGQLFNPPPPNWTSLHIFTGIHYPIIDKVHLSIFWGERHWSKWEIRERDRAVGR
jgi:hypothetical protein